MLSRHGFCGLLVYIRMLVGLGKAPPSEKLQRRQYPETRSEEAGRSHKIHRLETLSELLLMHNQARLGPSAPLSVGRRVVVSLLPGTALVLSNPAFAAGVQTLADRSTMDAISTQTPRTDDRQSEFIQLPSGLKYKDIQIGKGFLVQNGDTVEVQFTGRLLNLNGKKFMSTKDKLADKDSLADPDPYVFVVGEHTVIKGLEELVVGMAKRGVRRAVIPPSLGYDSEMTLGPRPENLQDLQALSSVVKNPRRDATLLLDVKVERVRPPQKRD